MLYCVKANIKILKNFNILLTLTPIGVNYGKVLANGNKNIRFKTFDNAKEATSINKLIRKVGEKYDIF